MKVKWLFYAALATAVLTTPLTAARIDAAQSAIEPYALQTESMNEPEGVDTPSPRFSWKSRTVDPTGAVRNQTQTAWQVVVANSLDTLAKDKGECWDSGKVNSADSLQVFYKGNALVSSRIYYWKVRVWDNAGNVSVWSEPARWVTGIMKAEDWKAKWIGQPASLRPQIAIDQASWIGARDNTAKRFVLAKTFELKRPQTDFDRKDLYALLRYAGNETFEIWVNGEKAGHSIGMVFNPDMLRTIDLSDRLVPGKNDIRVLVGSRTGQYAPLAFLAQLEIGEVDKSGVVNTRGVPSRMGQAQKPFLVVPTDDSWLCTTNVGKTWQTVSNADWGKSKAFFAPDKGPWGVVRRTAEKASPRFRKDFCVKKEVETACLQITGLGLFDASLDGKKIGKRLLEPAMTNYNKAVLYSTCDLTDTINKGVGRNRTLDVMLGHGWYDVRAIVTWNFDAAPWRDFPRMIAQLDLRYKDGTTESIVSDESWTTCASPCLFDCIRQGEIQNGAYVPRNYGNAVEVPAPKGKLRSSSIPPTIITEEFAPVAIRTLDRDTVVVDLGRDIAGWCRVKIRDAKKGDVVRFRYSERIDENARIERRTIAPHFMEGCDSMIVGEIGGFQTDFYICRGQGEETFEPRFTYNGFQYLEITGLRFTPEANDIVACIVHNDYKQIGHFRTSNELLNKIQAATLLSYRGNFVNGYPTDCPHREKNGWTGDAQLACEQAMYNWENTAAYEKWLRDLTDEQQPDGNLPGIVPTGGWGYPWGNGPAWDSSLVTIPWTLYRYRNDRRILEVNYDAMKKYVDFMTTKATNNLVSHGLGDWIPARTKTPVVVTSSGYYYLDTMIVAETARILGKSDDAQKYAALAVAIRDAYNKELAKGNGVYANGSQTAQSTAIHQGLVSGLSDAGRAQVFDRMVDAVTATGNVLDFGILGSKYLFRSLSEGGRTDLVLAMLLREPQPSFADWLRRGGGTLWEDWGEGSSRNHIMFGDVSAWFYQSLGGIKLPGGPNALIAQKLAKENDVNAFALFRIEPQCRKSDISAPGFKPIMWVDAETDSPYGPIRSAWKWNDKMTALTFTATVPVNTTCLVKLPFAARSVKPEEGVKPLAAAGNGNACSFKLGSGVWHFQVTPE